jgi:DTW domain-containing protein
MLVDTPKRLGEARCSRCWREIPACICSRISASSPKTRILILQHPREATNPLGTARLLSLSVPNAVHRVGLSWPSLSAALGEKVDNQQWGVLYVGTLKSIKALPPELPLGVLTRGGEWVEPKNLRGLVILDGNWKQSKTLWWRNPWLLRLNRVVLNPKQSSSYSPLRKQPRKQCLSTIEAAAECFENLEPESETPPRLREAFQAHIEMHARH